MPTDAKGKKFVTVRMLASELKNADVGFISLVRRGANQVPFRILKNEGEESMINVNNLWTRRTKADEAPAVVGVVVRKADAEAMKPSLEAAGFSVSEAVEAGETVIFKQADYAEDNVTVFKANENVAALVSNVKKSFEPYGQTLSFMESVNTFGFMPSVDVAMGSLNELIRSSLMMAENKADAVAKLDKALTDFHAYVLAVGQKLPDAVFKLYDIQKTEAAPEAATEAPAVEAPVESVEKAEHAGETCPEGMTMKDGKCVAKEKDTKKEDEVAEAPKAEVTEEVTKAAEVTEATEEAPVAEAIQETAAPVETVAKQEDSQAALVDALVAKMQESLSGVVAQLNEKIDAVVKSTNELNSRVEGVEAIAKSADEAVRGTVQVNSNDESLPGTRKVKSAGKDFWGGTALDVFANHRSE